MRQKTQKVLRKKTSLERKLVLFCSIKKRFIDQSCYHIRRHKWESDSEDVGKKEAVLTSEDE